MVPDDWWGETTARALRITPVTLPEESDEDILCDTVGNLTIYWENA
jgi:hypothetical protein